MKCGPLPIFLILALAFVHEANAGKIVGTLESADGPMDAAYEPMDEADGLMYAANGPMDRELIATNCEILGHIIILTSLILRDVLYFYRHTCIDQG